MLKTKKTKKVLALVLAVAMIISCMPLAGLLASAVTVGTTVLEDVNFDENNIVMRLGVVTDQHTTYDYDSVASTTAKIQKYANAVAVLDAAADHQLDAILSCGDYTSVGGVDMARTFASATKAIIDGINVGKEDSEKTRFMFSYGNHDTCWSGNMAISTDSANYTTCQQWDNDGYTWESLFNEYGLLDAQGAHIDTDVKGEGDYWYEIPTSAGNYYVLSVEIDSYDGYRNYYTQKTLDWVDETLAEITANGTGTKYVYVIGHAPIANSDVYGANLELEKDAHWAAYDAVKDEHGAVTEGVFDAILSKYSQVVYMSGHTHFSNNLESTIMSKNYTALTVSANDGGLASSKSEYLDNNGTGESHAILVEVDANGNQRIRRISKDKSTVTMTLDTTGSMVTNRNPNSAAVASYPNIAKVITNSATLNQGGNIVYYAHGDDWLMPTPNPTTKDHLKYLSALRGATPVFANDAAITVTNPTWSNTDGLSLTVEFPVATCTSKILQYRIAIESETGVNYGTYWALGNWCDSTKGIANGTSHYDATILKDTISGITKADSNKFKVKVYAVDEFGNISVPITTDVIEAKKSVTEPTIGTQTNYFSGLTTASCKALGTLAPTFSTDSNGIVTTFTNSTGAKGDSFAHYYLDATKLATASSMATVSPWGITPYQGFHTPFDTEDTFVFEGDFQISEGSTINIGFRVPTYTKSWEDNRAGIKITTSAVYLNAHNKISLKSSTAFKATADNSKHHFTILSEKDYVTLWIDGVKIFNSEYYGITGYEMVPCLYTYANATSAVFSNMKAYLYDELHKTVDTIGSAEKNYVDGANVTVTAPSGALTTSEIKNKKLNNFEVVSESTGYGMTNVTFTPSNNDLKATDTVTYEFDYSISNIQTVSGGRTFADIYFPVRKDKDGKTVQFLIRSNGQFGIYYSDATFDAAHKTNLSGYSPLAVGKSYHIKFISTPTALTVYINGIKAFDNVEYSIYDTFDTATLKPTLYYSVRGGSFKFENFKIYAEGKTIGCVPTCENSLSGNLAIGNYGSTVCAMDANSCDFQFRGNDGSVNMYCDWLRDHGSTSYYSGNSIFFLGSNNSNYSFDSTKSYVLSATVNKSNNETAPYSGSGNYTSRLSFSAGQYEGSEAWCFLTDTAIVFYAKGQQVGVTYHNIKNFQDFRYTMVATPFGYKIYADGMYLGGYDYPNPENFTYNPLYRVNGTKSFFRDVEMYEYYDYDAYAAKIIETSAKLASYGEWGVSTVDGYQAIIAASVLTANNYTNGTATGDAVKTAYFNIKAVADSFSVPNNYLVRDGVTFSTVAQYAPVFTSTSNGFTLDQSQAGCDSVNETNVNVDRPVYFNGLNVTAEDSLVVEYDFTAKDAIAGDTRVNFYYGTVGGKNAYFMIQGSGLFTSANGTWVNVGSLPASTQNGSAHIKYTVNAGVGMTIEYYCSAGYKKYTWNWADTYGDNFAIVPTPRLEFKKQNITVSNLFVGTDVVDKYGKVKGDYDAINASYTGSYSTTVDAATALNSVKAVLDKGYKVATIAELSAAATTLQSLKNSLTVKNNWVLDGTLNLVGESVNVRSFKKTSDSSFTVDYSNSARLLGVFPSGEVNADMRKVNFKLGSDAIPNDAAYVLDFDVKISDTCFDVSNNKNANVRMSFFAGSINGSVKRIMVQDNVLYITDASNGYKNVGSVVNIANGGNFHVTYKVNPSYGITFKLVNLANNQAYNYTLDFASEYGANYTYVSGAYFLFRSAKFEVTKLYAGYDLDVYKTALQAEVDGIAVADLSGYSDATVKAYNDALTEVNGVITNYKNYSKDEIVGAAAPLTLAKTGLKAADKIDIGVNVGGDDKNSYNVALGETLITKEKIGTKFIIGWKNNDGEDVTTYDGSTVTPEFIETEMLHVLKQFYVDKDGDVTMRLLATVDRLDRYKSVTWTFSLNDETFANPAVRESTRVYGAVMENGKSVKPSEKFALFASTSAYTDYANFFMYFDITGIDASKFSDGTSIYVHANVVLNDDTAVDGRTYKVELANYAEVLGN